MREDAVAVHPGHHDVEQHEGDPAASKLFNIKWLGILFNPHEKNTMIQRNEIYRWAKSHGFEVVDLRAPPALDQLEQNLQQLTDKTVTVDVVYLPADSFLISQAALIGSKLRSAKVKAIGATKAFIDKGVLIGVVPDYYRLGQAVADILHRNRSGQDLRTIPVARIYRSEAPTLVVNRATQTAIGSNISESILSNAVIVR